MAGVPVLWAIGKKRKNGPHRSRNGLVSHAHTGGRSGRQVAVPTGCGHLASHSQPGLGTQGPALEQPQRLGLLLVFPSRVLWSDVSRRSADAAHPCAGQGARPVQDPLQHSIEIEAFADVHAGLAQPGEPLPERRYSRIGSSGRFISSPRLGAGPLLPHRVVWSIHLVTSIGHRAATPAPADGRDSGQPGQLCHSPRKVTRSHRKTAKSNGYITRGWYNWG